MFQRNVLEGVAGVDGLAFDGVGLLALLPVLLDQRPAVLHLAPLGFDKGEFILIGHIPGGRMIKVSSHSSATFRGGGGHFCGRVPD